MGRWIVADPQRLRQGHGTVLVSTVHRARLSSPLQHHRRTVHTLTIFAGSLSSIGWSSTPKARWRSGAFVCLSGAIDHDIVDGVAIAGLAESIVQLMEIGGSLDQSFIDETRRLLAKDRA